MKDWVSYQEINFHDNNYNKFSIDTRDFHCIAGNVELPKLNIVGAATNPEKYFFTPEELKILIDRYYTESGGEGEWRMFSLEDEGKNYSRGWQMKYLRILRMKRGLVICTEFHDKYIVYKKSILNSPVCQKYLNHY